MRIKELIKLLSKFDQKKEVVLLEEGELSPQPFRMSIFKEDVYEQDGFVVIDTRIRSNV